jgi:uncharacterized protein YutE (UPF0331/DUF86 family)
METEYNIERFGAIFSDIQRYLQDLEDLSLRQEDDLNDKRNFYAASMILFSLLNRILDLGSEMVISHNLGIPSTNREIFVLLQKNGLIGPDLGKEMMGLVTFRNLLSHEYHGIDQKKLFALTKKIGIMREFIAEMKKTIRDNTPA